MSSNKFILYTTILMLFLVIFIAGAILTRFKIFFSILILGAIYMIVKSIKYMSITKNYEEKIMADSTKQKPITFTSCPEYWKKETNNNDVTCVPTEIFPDTSFGKIVLSEDQENYTLKNREPINMTKLNNTQQEDRCKAGNDMYFDTELPFISDNIDKNVSWVEFVNKCSSNNN